MKLKKSFNMFASTVLTNRVQCLLIVWLGILSCISAAAQTQTFTTVGTSTWTAPPGVSQVTVQAWGAGGAGGRGGASNRQGGGGGAGGQFSTKVITVTPGTSYSIFIGAGGTAGTTNGNPGGRSAFKSATDSCVAQGGAGGGAYNSTTSTGLAGIGVTTGGVGTVVRGGSGANGTASLSGGGGGGAGSTALGKDASGATAGAATTASGGAGGAGTTSNSANGGAGSNYGGGGGGATRGGIPGAGAQGQVTLTWTCPAYSLTGVSTSGPICRGTASTITLSGTANGLPVGTYTLTYTLSGANTAAATNVTLNVTTAGTASFTTGVLNNTGSTTITITQLAATGCSSAVSSNNTATITVNGPAVSITGGTSGCSALTLTATSATATSYSWSGGTSKNTATNSVTASGSYTVTATDAAGCTATSSTTVTINPLPSVSISGSSSVCSGSSTNLTASGASSYLWSTGASTSAITVSPVTASVYSVTGTDVNGCTATASQTVAVNSPPVAPVAGDNARCGTGTVSITATPGSGETIDWYATSSNGTILTGGSGTLNFITPSITATTIYYAQSRNIAAGCTSLTRTPVTATVNTLPTPVTVSVGGNLCGQAELTASGGVGGTIYFQGTVNGGTSTATPSSFQTVTSTGTYYFNAMSTAGCWGTQGSATVSSIISPPVSTGVTICPGGTGSLTTTSVCADLTGQTSGPRDAGTGANITGVGTLAWSTPANIAGAGTAGMSIASGITTNYLRGTNYGFALPSNAVINGITVVINRSSSAGASPLIRDNRISLVKGGVVQATNKAVTGTNWPTSLADASYGGAADLWNTTWTVADINASNFGVVLSAVNNNGSARTAAVDYIRVTVTYTLPGVMNWYTASSGGTFLGSGSSFNPVGVIGSGLSNTLTPGTTTYYVECSNQAGCRQATNFTINPSPLVTITGNNSICQGLSTSLTANGAATYAWNTGATTSAITVSPTSTTSYTVTGTSANGCTATATRVVTVNTPTSSNSSAEACVSYTWNGTTYTQSGTYSFNSTNSKGCDSTATLNLTINQPTTSTTAATSCASYSWNGNTYTQSGTYTFSTINSNGCDSTATLNLTIDQPTASSSVTTACGSYTWNGTNYTQSGTYTYNTTTHQGCDSTATLNLIIDQPTSSTNSATACASYNWNGTNYTQSGTYTYNTTTHQGCDSTATLNLTVYQPTTSTISATDCASYTWNGTTYTQSGTYTYSTINSNGCDSTATLLLTISADATNTTTVSSCSDYTWSVNNQVYTSSGTYTVTNGCLTEILQLTINTASEDPVSITSNTAIGCSNAPVTFTVNGGSLGTAASWSWYAGSCTAGTLIGTGSSITTTEDSAGSYDYYVRAEGTCNITSCVSTSLLYEDVPRGIMSIITAPEAGCVGATATIVASSLSDALGYIWTAADGGVLFNGQMPPCTTVTPSVTISYTAAPSAGASGYTVCVTPYNRCGSSPSSVCHWIRYSIGTPSVISGNVQACPSTSSTYSVTPLSGASSYVWTITGNATFDAGVTTITTTSPSVNVNFLSTFSGSQLCVSGRTSCDFAGASRCLTISSVPTLPGAVSGSQYICPGSTNNIYSVAAVAGAVSYVWTVTGTGLSIVGNGLSAVVTATSSFTSGSVCVQAVNSCGVQSAQRCRSVTSGRVGTPGNITGSPLTGVCGQTYTYSVPAMTLATLGYTWTIPAGVTVIGASNLNTITLQFPTNFTSGQLCVRGNSECGPGFDRCATVSGNPATPGVITGPTGVCRGSSQVYSWAAVSGATQYQITVPSGASVVGGSTTTATSVTVVWGNTSGNVVVRAQNNCGLSGSRTLAVTVSVCRTIDGTTASSDFTTTLFPNPVHELLNVRFESAVEEIMQMRITDLSGRLVKEYSLVSNIGENFHELNVIGMTPGMYWLTIQGEQSGKSNEILVVQ